MKNKNLIISSIAVLIILGVGFGSMKFFAAQKEEPPVKPIVVQDKFVKALSVKNGNIPVKVIAHGRVGTAQPLDLTTEVSGKVEAGNVPLKAGQAFKKGDVLFRIEQNTAYLSLKAQKSTFFNLIAGILPDLKIDYPESYPKWQEYFNNIDIDKDLAELPESKGLKEKTFLASRNILTNYFTIKSEESRLKKAVVRAPYSGSITEVLLEIGSFANLNTRVARIIRTDQLEVDLPLEISQIKWIKVGSPVLLSNKEGQTWKGAVKRIGSFVNQNTQSINVFVGLDNNGKGPIAYDGLYLQAEISGIEANNVMEIPRSALYDEGKIYVIENNQLKTRQVSIEKVNEETLLVSGLKDGEQVVPEPVINARESMPVKILDI